MKILHMKILHYVLFCAAWTTIFWPVDTSADIIYEFRGVLPQGASQIPEVGDGESFTVTFRIDETTPDLDPDTDRGVYTNVLFGLVEFSGGFSQRLGAGPLATFVGNDNRIGVGETYDFVAVQSTTNAAELNVVAIVEDFAAPNVLADDRLPMPGVEFSTSTVSNVSWVQFRLNDSTGSGIRYGTAAAANVMFSARSIPEPLATGWLAFTAVFVFAGRRRSGTS